MSTSRTARRGASAIEFALLLPLLVLLFAGIADLSHYLLLSDELVDAVAEGARAGAQAEDSSQAISTADVVAKIAWNNSSPSTELDIEASLTGSAPNRWLSVTGGVPYVSWFGFLGLPETITYTSTMRLVDQ